jgi:hypothetical protein
VRGNKERPNGSAKCGERTFPVHLLAEDLVLIAVEVKKDDRLAVVCLRAYNIHE